MRQKHQHLIFQKITFSGRKTNLKFQNKFFGVQARKTVFLTKLLLNNLNQRLRGFLYFLGCGKTILIFEVMATLALLRRHGGAQSPKQSLGCER